MRILDLVTKDMQVGIKWNGIVGNITSVTNYGTVENDYQREIYNKLNMLY